VVMLCNNIGLVFETIFWTEKYLFPFVLYLQYTYAMWVSMRKSKGISILQNDLQVLLDRELTMQPQHFFHRRITN
jgi:hypothetical protein